MTSPLVNFLSYNSTGMNSIKAAWISDLLQVTNSHFIGIQEHLKRNKTVDKFFRDQFSDYNTYVVPAHRDQGQDSGRAKGGLAALSSRNLDIQCHRIKTNSFRLQAQTLEFPNVRILWINVYLPTDPQTQDNNTEELLSVLREIENVMDIANFDDCIV